MRIAATLVFTVRHLVRLWFSITATNRRAAAGCLGCASILRTMIMALIMALGLLCTGPTTAQTQAHGFRLIGLDDKTYTLADYRGRWVVLNFWATWCSPCLKEMPELQRFHQRHPQVAVWGITFEDTPKDTMKAFVKRLGVTYPIMGQGQQPYTPFGEVTGLPTTFLVNPEGRFHRAIRGTVTAAELEAAISIPH